MRVARDKLGEFVARQRRIVRDTPPVRQRDGHPAYDVLVEDGLFGIGGQLPHFVGKGTARHRLGDGIDLFVQFRAGAQRLLEMMRPEDAGLERRRGVAVDDMVNAERAARKRRKAGDVRRPGETAGIAQPIFGMHLEELRGKEDHIEVVRRPSVNAEGLAGDVGTGGKAFG